MLETQASPEYRPSPSLPEGFYRVGDDGSVWSCQRKGRGAGKTGPWKRLKEIPSGKGYKAVRTGYGGQVFARYIHRLVLEAFVGPCPEGMEACHNDGDRANNRLDNLRWDTPKNNQADRAKHGTKFEGSQLPWAVLSEEQIPTIRARAASGESVAEIARQHGVSWMTIQDVVAGRTWKHVG